VAPLPQHQWLIARLSRENIKKCKVEIIERHAAQIYDAIIAIRAGDAHSGSVLWPDVQKQPARRGTANELISLEKIARRAALSDSPIWRQRWVKAWAAASGTTRRVVWKPNAPPVIQRKFDRAGKIIAFERAPIGRVFSFSGHKLNFIAPLPADAIPLIAEARRQIAAVPAANRRIRKPNQLPTGLGYAVRAAFEELTGRSGITIDPYAEGASAVKGGLIELGKEIEREFNVKLVARLRLPKKLTTK
jgi:hypothetical protein